MSARTRLAARRGSPADRARRAILQKALVVALRNLPEEEVKLTLIGHWMTWRRLEALERCLP